MFAYSGTTMSYQWLKNGSNIAGAKLRSYTITNVQASDQATYSVQINNAGGMVTSSGATLTVLFPPAITTQPQSQAVARHQNVLFSVVASGTSPFTYQWYFNSSSLGGAAQSSTLTLNNVGMGNAGSYTVVVTNAGGSVTSLVATLTVYIPPGIQTQPQNQTVTQGQSASFSVAANGSAPFGYQWNFDGITLSGATNATLALTNAQGTNAGSYTVEVTNLAGSVTSQVATLTVNIPPGITTQPQSQAVVQGQNGSFSVVATGTANLRYQWYFNGSSLGGGAAQSATLTLNNIGTNNAGSYTVVVNNNWGSATSAVATLTVVCSGGDHDPAAEPDVGPGSKRFVLCGSERHGAIGLSVALGRRGLVRRQQCCAGAHQCSDDQRRQLHGGGGELLGFGHERGGVVDRQCSTGDHDRSRKARRRRSIKELRFPLWRAARRRSPINGISTAHRWAEGAKVPI